MNKEEIKKLTDKYKAGASTLGEEQFLFNSAENSDPAIEAWSAFVKQKKKAAPADLNNSIWEAIQTKKIKKRRLSIRIMSAAASVLLLFSISINHLSTNKMSIDEKEALLSEALNMLEISEQKEIEQNIIYEDEMIIIYTASE